jgi:hypothetical protein
MVGMQTKSWVGIDGDTTPKRTSHQPLLPHLNCPYLPKLAEGSEDKGRQKDQHSGTDTDKASLSQGQTSWPKKKLFCLWSSARHFENTANATFKKQGAVAVPPLRASAGTFLTYTQMTCVPSLAMSKTNFLKQISQQKQ